MGWFMNTDFLYLEIDTFCIAILLLLMVRMVRADLQRYGQILYQKLTFSVLGMCVMDAAWYMVEGRSFNGALELNLLLNFCFYLLANLSAYYWFLFSEHEQGNQFTRTLRGRLICALPMLFLLGFNLASISTGWVFYVNGQNQWHPGPYLWVQLLICDGYVFLTACKALHKALHTDIYAQREKFLWMSFYAVPCLLAGVVVIFTLEVAMSCISSTFSVLMVYISLQDQQISLDPLTRLNNRHELHKYLQEAVKRCRNNGRLYLVVLDIDSFKSINDKYGHVEGDKALLRLAAALKETSKTFNCFIARYGGDEFIILHEAADQEELEALTGKLHQSLEKLNQAEASPYKLTVSLGYARYEPPLRNDEDLIAAADVKLYEAKRSKIR